MSEQSRKAFEAYWRARQLRTHRYTDRECPEDWGLAFKADAESAWQASRAAALEEAVQVCELQAASRALSPLESYRARYIADAIRSLAEKTGKD